VADREGKRSKEVMPGKITMVDGVGNLEKANGKTGKASYAIGGTI
jgi:hypothetical protein